MDIAKWNNKKKYMYIRKSKYLSRDRTKNI